ncbi:predicted protein [Uncinocarpus reesii 1704]|uniref:Uncharacterized protein n=1 Tax=Uncinocarpus reesii (strain UAMH 1704) TaxID=336963 RepID=C4JX73_UNCRE|nr:uncharacterized protein UREG_06246 [Uncinocarpus reesii 1704]EEP81381.1 predicted protein [Uncinocarpus reesii 1704]
MAMGRTSAPDCLSIFSILASRRYESRSASGCRGQRVVRDGPVITAVSTDEQSRDDGQESSA